jgi:hypothetical protein
VDQRVRSPVASTFNKENGRRLGVDGERDRMLLSSSVRSFDAISQSGELSMVFSGYGNLLMLRD